MAFPKILGRNAEVSLINASKLTIHINLGLTRKRIKVLSTDEGLNAEVRQLIAGAKFCCFLTPDME